MVTALLCWPICWWRLVSKDSILAYFLAVLEEFFCERWSSIFWSAFWEYSNRIETFNHSDLAWKYCPTSKILSHLTRSILGNRYKQALSWITVEYATIRKNLAMQLFKQSLDSEWVPLDVVSEPERTYPKLERSIDAERVKSLAFQKWICTY